MSEQETFKQQVKKLLVEVDFLLDQIVVPEAHCTCFINPPCSDCVENGALRESVRDVRKAMEELNTSCQ